MHLLSKTNQISESTKREGVVSLRPLFLDDIDSFMEWATDNEVTQYMMWNTYASRFEAEAFFSGIVAPHPWFKAICLDGKVIGSITLDKGKGAHACKAELGYVIARKYWRMGWGSEAVKLAIESGFNDLGVQRIEAFVDPTNRGSQRVLEKNGFTREGLLRNYLIQKGDIKDRLIYSYTI